MSDFLVSASLYNLNQYCSSHSELECPAVDVTWIEVPLMVSYYFCFDEQSPASFPELSLKGNISKSVEKSWMFILKEENKKKSNSDLP